MNSPRRFLPILLLCGVITAALLPGAVVHADALPWTKAVGFFDTIQSLQKQCTKDGGTGTPICYNKSNDTWTAWSSTGCSSGFTPAVWCKARAPAPKPTTTAPAPTTTTKPATSPSPTTKTTAPVTTTSHDTGGGAGSTNTGGGAGSTNTGGGAGSVDTGGGAGGTGQIQTLQNPLKFNSLPELLTAILNAVVELGSILLVFMLVWVGFLFVTAQGNPEKISAARSALIWTLIGGLILLGATAISKVIEATVQSL